MNFSPFNSVESLSKLRIINTVEGGVGRISNCLESYSLWKIKEFHLFIDKIVREWRANFGGKLSKLLKKERGGRLSLKSLKDRRAFNQSISEVKPEPLDDETKNFNLPIAAKYSMRTVVYSFDSWLTHPLSVSSSRVLGLNSLIIHVFF